MSKIAPTPAFAYHAAPPPGEWINDPNGLVFAGGRYRLFVQHRADAPEFAVTGWARLSSDDLLDWDWDGVVLAPNRSGWAYSGSVLAALDGTLEAFHTRHRKDEGPLQTQHRATSRNAGLTWDNDPEPIGPSGRNVRDPFVFAYHGERRMLLARPCDWIDWAGTPASVIEILACDGGASWRRVGTIGPWVPSGVMWEVPVLLDFGSCWALIVSIVDRREGTACGVHYWLGAFDGIGFAPRSGWPVDGRALDLGLDFYACIANTGEGWPDTGRVLVGWASSWATARASTWPGAIAGGPISLPRRLTLDAAGARLRQRPLDEARPRAWGSYRVEHGAFRLTVRSSAGTVTIGGKTDASTSILKVERSTDDSRFDCIRKTRLDAQTTAEWTLTLFIDGPLVELFMEPGGLTVTVALPGGDHKVDFTSLAPPGHS